MRIFGRKYLAFANFLRIHATSRHRRWFICFSVSISLVSLFKPIILSSSHLSCNGCIVNRVSAFKLLTLLIEWDLLGLWGLFKLSFDSLLELFLFVFVENFKLLIQIPCASFSWVDINRFSFQALKLYLIFLLKYRDLFNSWRNHRGF